VRPVAGEGGGDAVELDRPGEAVEQADAVEQDAAGKPPSTKYLRPASAERSSLRR
jgi:hypothetical protein